jgi:hypothetical protein
MKKRELAQHIAELEGLPPAEAADQVDKAVHRIIRALKNGQTAKLPGLGTLTPGSDASGRRWIFKRLRRSRKLTHFCSVRLTHLKNKMSV